MNAKFVKNIRKYCRKNNISYGILIRDIRRMSVDEQHRLRDNLRAMKQSGDLTVDKSVVLAP